MSTVLVSLAAGAVVSALLWLALRPSFQAPIFARTNYRGVEVPVGAGIVLALSTVALSAVAALRDARSTDLLRAEEAGGSMGQQMISEYAESQSPPLLALVVIAAIGFALLGLFDDLGATGDDRGFRGHLRAMASGRLTTGGVKVLFGGGLAIYLAARINGGHLARLPVDAALIALAANVGNLFDRAPGRTTKVALLTGLPLVALTTDSDTWPVALVLGAAIGLLAFDLREQLMLGDTGSNVLGAVIGLGVVAGTAFPVRIGLLVLVLALNLASEKVSFSKVIDKVAPLRFVDRLGRRPLD